MTYTLDNDGTVMGEDSGGDSSSDDESDEDEDGDEAMEDAGGPSEPPPPVNRAPEVDDDGFTLVQKGGRRR